MFFFAHLYKPQIWLAAGTAGCRNRFRKSNRPISSTVVMCSVETLCSCSFSRQIRERKKVSRKPQKNNDISGRDQSLLLFLEVWLQKGKKGRNNKALVSQMPKIPDWFLRDVQSAGFFTARLQEPEEINLSEHAYRSGRRKKVQGRYKLKFVLGHIKYLTRVIIP